MATNRMFMLGRCAASVAHEVNNPLSAVTANLSHVQVCLDMDDPPRKSMGDALDDAVKGALQVSRIITAFRSVARSDALRGVPMDTVVEDARILAAHPVRASASVRVQLHADTPGGRVPRLAGDGGVLLQALVNLLLFAADHMPPHAREPEVGIRVLRAPDDLEASEVGVAVTSSGPAPTPALLEPGAIPPALPSIGMARVLVESLGGQVHFLALERGYEVVLVMPAHGAVMTNEPAPTPPSPERAAILIIDDNHLVATSVERMLESEFDVRVQSNGRSALVTLASGPPPDVVLCDLMMPGLTGEELYLQAPPEVRSRFIFVTGGFVMGSTLRFLEEHGVPWLEKPFDRSVLLELIRRIVATR